MDHKEQFAAYYEIVEDGLPYYLPHTPIEQVCLFDAVHYSLLDAGKRIRPILLLEFVRLCGADPKDALPFACALEMIHTYSLIHDDLPCMDNSDMRRGKPSNHAVFGETTAVLAGDALLTYAFETILDEENIKNLDPKRVIKAAHSLAWNAGIYGMVGGQFLDMYHHGLDITPEAAAKICELKTGALIRSAAEMGCILGGASDEMTEAALSYAGALGLAFQIKDDILNIDGDAEKLGKDTGTDKINDKLTFVRVLGLQKCKELLEELTQKAKASISELDDNGFLIWLSDFLLKREC